MAYAVGDTFKVGISSWMDGQLGLILRYYVVNAVTGVQLAESAIAEGFFQFLGDDLADCMAIDAAVLGVAVRNINSVPAETFSISTGTEKAGTVSGDELPTQTCGIITLNTARSGRSYRGRSYIPFPAAADNDVDARPTTAYMTALTALAVDLLAQVTVTSGGNSTTFDPVVFSKKIPAVTILTATVARRKWATQRSRGSYGQSNPRVIAGV